jgi:O-antigen/teichoic acid export membrane protein
MASNTRFAFFRQSGWMVIATQVGGVFMLAVHTVARKMGPQEYATFVSLLRFLIILGIPASALQMIFARQAAAATTEHEEHQLQATTRALAGLTSLLGLLFALAIVGDGRHLARLLNVSNPVALYLTAVLALLGLWVPMGKGILQGKHHFGGLGWLQISDGVIRFCTMLWVVLALGGKAAGGMFAATAGQIVTVLIAIWLTRGIWGERPKVPFHWKKWLGQAVPLTLGLGAVLAMSSIDMLFVQGLFVGSASTALYGGAMLTGFAIIQISAPVANVMFARVTRNVARAEQADSFLLTLLATAGFGALAAIGCTLLPQWPLRVMYLRNPEMWQAAPLVPWFAWALLPWAVANVLVQNILAHGRYRSVPWLVLIPAVYAAALCLQAPHLVEMDRLTAFTRVIQTLGCASLLLCGVAAWFCRGARALPARGPGLAPARAVSGKASAPAE